MSPPPAIPQPLAAALAGRYTLERELGRGGMAAVWLARDLRHHRAVALKVFSPELAESVGAERFLREIEVAASLLHPHIVPLLDSGEVGGLLWYAMPVVEGESLRERLDRERQLPVADAVRIAREAADALAYAHAHGVVHRDVKPGNILLQDGHALVADFGIALALQGGLESRRLTASGLSLGTPAYMSPEQATADRALDARSDQYSLACVLYEMLAGEPPFAAPTAQAAIARRLAEPPPRVRTLRDAVPPALEAAIARAMARLPADRFASMEDFVRALAAAAAAADAPVAVPVAVPARGRRRGARSTAIVLGAAAAVGGLALLARPGAAPGVVAPASVLAVVPPVPTTGDTALARLGRDLAVTVGRTLDGIGGMRSVDPQAVLAQHPDPGGRAGALALGRRLGAGSVLSGSLVRVGGRVRADLALVAGDSAAPLARVTAAAPADSIEALTDSIVRGLLRQVWRGGAAPSPSIDAAFRTRSLEALRAFLAGEQQLSQLRMREAGEAYRRAVDADSTFWLAMWRLRYVGEWQLLPEDTALTAAVAAHRGELPPRERLMVEAELRLPDSVSGALAAWENITARWPDYWFGWLVLADHLTHAGPLVGRPVREAMAAFERALALHPGLIPAWEHYFWLALQEDDTAASNRAVAALERLDAADELHGQGWDEMASLRLADRLRRGDTLGARPLWARHARDLAGRADPTFGATALLRHGLAGDQVRLSREVLAAGPPAGAAAAHHAAIAQASFMRGDWATGLDVLDTERAAAVRGGRAAAFRYAVVGAWLGALPPAAPARWRPAALEAARDGPPGARADLAWLDGVWAAARRDPAALAGARAALERVQAPGTAVLRRSLAGLAAALAGDAARAGRDLAALEWERAERNLPEEETHPLLLVVDRSAAAGGLLAAGDTAQAGRLLLWADAAYASIPGVDEAYAAAPLVQYERGRLAEASGSGEEARRLYREFVRTYDRPPPAHRALVRHAESYLDAVRGR